METIVSKPNGKSTQSWLGGPKMNRDNVRPTVVEPPKKPTTDTLTFSVEDIDAAKALKYLETQEPDTNRHVSDTRVDAFADVMRLGKWRLNSQPIGFDTEGHLVDGQHRLWAIVRANVTVRIAVAYGLDDEGVKTIDRGRVRSIAESLRRDSIIPQSLRKECGRISAWRQAEVLMLTSRGVPGSTEATEMYYEANRTAVEFAIETLPKRGALKPSALGAAIIFAMRRYPDEVKQFAEQLVEMEGLDKTSPVLGLYKYIDRSTGNVAEIRRPLSIKTLNCIKMFVEGTPMPKDARLFAMESAIQFFSMGESATARKAKRR